VNDIASEATGTAGRLRRGYAPVRLLEAFPARAKGLAPSVAIPHGLDRPPPLAWHL